MKFGYLLLLFALVVIFSTLGFSVTEGIQNTNQRPMSGSIAMFQRANQSKPAQ